jgi:DNA polymerase III subunit beta
MKISCLKDDLYKCVQIVEKSVGTKSSLPIMGNILIETLNDSIKLASNNLEIGMEVIIPAKIDKPGKTLVPAKTLLSIVSKLPNDSVEIEVFNNNLIKIICNQSKFNINCMPADEFLMLPKITEGEQIKINATLFKSLIKKVLFSVSLDESKHILNGVYFKFGADDDKSKFTMVATDGYRLALANANLDTEISKESNFVIPTKALNEISNMITTDDDILITHQNDQVSFQYQNNYLVTRIIQGQFPDYNQVVPKSSNSVLTIERTLFLKAAERCAIIASSSANIVKLESDKSKLLISAKTPDVGEVSELINISIEGEENTQVSFNVRLLIDVLKTLESDKIDFSLSGAFSPGLIKEQGNNDYTYVIMPIKTTDNT